MEYIYTISEFIIMVFLYSCVGWLMEVILKFIEYKRFINRGYLIGPYCPIYGVGVGIITLTVDHFIRTGNCSEIFLIGMVICGIWEYFISWAMEKLFHGNQLKGSGNLKKQKPSHSAYQRCLSEIPGETTSSYVAAEGGRERAKTCETGIGGQTKRTERSFKIFQRRSEKCSEKC